MRKLAIGIAILFWLLPAGAVTLAAENVKPLPNLLGTWAGEKKIYYQKGETRSTTELRITEQDGAYFRGFHVWEQSQKKDPLGHVRGENVYQASEPIMGIIAYDSTTIYMVEHGDLGHLNARLAGPDTMEVVYMESGPNAAVFRIILHRKH